MKFHFNLKYFIAWLLIVIISNYSIANYSTLLEKFTKTDKNMSSTWTTLTVELWDIKNSIEVVWNSELVDEQSLSFNKVWTITKVNFKAWDTVKKGEIIAEIDNSDANNSIEEAQISLENANISLKQLYEPVDESKIIQAKNSIVTATNNLANSKKEFENLKITQENSLTKLLESINTSKKDLENLMKSNDNSFNNTSSNKSTTVSNIENSFKTYSILIEKIIEESDHIMWVTEENKDKNDSYEYYLWAKDAILTSKTKKLLIESISLYKDLKDNLGYYDYSWDREKMKALLSVYQSMFDNLYNTTDYIYKTVDNSIPSLWALTDSEISSMKNTMSSDRSNTLSQISSIKTQINTLNTLTDTELLWESNELDIEKQKISINNAEKSYNETVATYKLNIESKEQDIETKEINLEVANLSLTELLEWPTEDNIRKANNSIKQAQIKLDSSQESLDDYMLTAPFDWVIRKIDYMVWDNLSTDTGKYVYIENPNLVEIKVMLDQIDIVTVKLNQESTITFDTFSTIPVKAKISSIDTTPVQSSWVVSYEVKLILEDKSFDKKILSWMTANVEIITESRENVVVLKTTAIKEKDGKNYVIVEKDWKQVETDIVTWISSNGMSEIVSGLVEWDVVVLEQFVSTTTTQEETSTSLFPTWWWWWTWDRQGPPWWF